MKRGGCKFGGSKTGDVLCPKRGAVVSQLVLKLKESVPPPPGLLTCDMGLTSTNSNPEIKKKCMETFPSGLNA